MIGTAIVALLTFNNTTCFDLAEVFTFGNELRAMKATGASLGAVALTSLPAVAIAMLGAACIWCVMFRRQTPAALHAERRPRGACLSLSIWLASIAVPVVLLARGIGVLIAEGGVGRVQEFSRLYGSDMSGSILLAVAVGITIALIEILMGRGNYPNIYANGLMATHTIKFSIR